MVVKEISKTTKDFNLWDDNRIKNAFNNGKGTIKDFENYMENNKKYVDFEVIEK